MFETDTDGYSFHDLDTFWVRRQFNMALWCAWNLAILTVIASILLQRLLQKIMEDRSNAEETASYGYNADIVQAVKVIIALLIYFIYCIWSDALLISSLVWRAYDWTQTFWLLSGCQISSLCCRLLLLYAF